MKLLCLLKASFTAFCLEARLKEPFDDNLRRLNEDMSRLYPQDDLVFRSMEQMLDNYAESVRVFRDVTLWASVTILFIILMGLVGYVDDEIRLRSKEIAIRKVNGAETSGILRLLSRDVLWISIFDDSFKNPPFFCRKNSFFPCYRTPCSRKLTSYICTIRFYKYRCFFQRNSPNANSQHRQYKNGNEIFYESFLFFHTGLLPFRSANHILYFS